MLFHSMNFIINYAKRETIHKMYFPFINGYENNSQVYAIINKNICYLTQHLNRYNKHLFYNGNLRLIIKS